MHTVDSRVPQNGAHLPSSVGSARSPEPKAVGKVFASEGSSGRYQCTFPHVSDTSFPLSVDQKLSTIWWLRTPKYTASQNEQCCVY